MSALMSSSTLSDWSTSSHPTPILTALESRSSAVTAASVRLSRGGPVNGCIELRRLVVADGVQRDVHVVEGRGAAFHDLDREEHAEEPLPPRVTHLHRQTLP